MKRKINCGKMLRKSKLFFKNDIICLNNACLNNVCLNGVIMFSYDKSIYQMKVTPTDETRYLYSVSRKLVYLKLKVFEIIIHFYKNDELCQ